MNADMELLYQSSKQFAQRIEHQKGQLDTQAYLIKTERIHDQIQHHNNLIQYFTGLSLVALVLIPVVYWWSLHIPLCRRLDNLTARIEAIARGDLSINYPKFPESELGILKRLDNSFNEMSLALAITISTLKRQLRQVSYSAEQVAEVSQHEDLPQTVNQSQAGHTTSSDFDKALVSSFAYDLVDSSEVVNLMLSSFKFDLDEGFQASFPDERRDFDRIEASIRVELCQDHWITEKVTRDFSTAGLSVLISDVELARLNPAEPLNIRLFLPKTVKLETQHPTQVLALNAHLTRLGERLGERFNEQVRLSIRFSLMSEHEFIVLQTLFNYFAE
ncbi:PilZ domain-containing protein [Catenovulum sediminis]